MDAGASVERVAAVARHLMDEGYVGYEVDAWRTAVLIVAACGELTEEADADSTE